MNTTMFDNVMQWTWGYALVLPWTTIILFAIVGAYLGFVAYSLGRGDLDPVRRPRPPAADIYQSYREDYMDWTKLDFLTDKRERMAAARAREDTAREAFMRKRASGEV